MERKWGKRTFKPHWVGDKVWLEGTNLKLSHPSAKLAARHYGPFRVSKVISPVVYQLELPTTWKIFNTFHAVLLLPYKEMEEHGVNFTEPPPDLIEDHEEYEVEQILDTRLFEQWKKHQYLIKWKGYAEAHNSWKPEENVNVPELVKEFHQRTSARIRLWVLRSEGEPEELTMTQLVDSSTPLPHSHSPRLFSPFSIDHHGDHPLLNQILLNGLPLQQPWYDDSSPYMCQVARHKAVDQEAQEQLAAATMAKLPYAIATSANDDIDNEENDTCTYQDDPGTLADPPSPGGGCASSLQVHQQATP